MNETIRTGMEQIRNDVEKAIGQPDPAGSFQPFGERTPEKLAAAARHQEPTSELERFLASAEQMLETLRQRMLASQSRYELERVRLADGFRVRMRNLEHEAGEALRALDRKHAAKAAADHKLFEVLTGMRGRE